MPNGSTITNYKSGNIVIVSFYDGSDMGKRIGNDANDVWYSLPDEVGKYTGSPLNFDARKTEVKQLMNKFKVKKLPAVLFLEKKEGTDWELKNTLTGNVPREAIEATYYRVINNLYGRGDNALSKAAKEKDSLIPMFKNEQSFLNLPNGMVRFGMGLIGILATAKAARSKNNAGRIAYGSIAAYTGYTLFYPGHSSIHFE